MEKLKSFIIQCTRVWRVLKKPTKQEFLMISKISALGVLAIGLVGFLIGLIMKLFS